MDTKVPIILDISWPVSEQMTAYKDKKIVSIKSTRVFEEGGVRESILTLGTHTGTHIDAPAHFLKNGATIDQVALDRLVGPCRVLNMMTVEEKITIADLEKYHFQAGDRILFKTKNSLLSETAGASTSFIYLDGMAAPYLAEQRVSLVGIDYLGIERNQPEHPTHRALLEAGICILEGLRLKEVEPGNYFLCCLPLKILGAEAAPARVTLLKF